MRFDTIVQIESFSMRMKKAMNTRNMKSIDLSKATGLSESTISKYLNGKHEPPREKLCLLAEVLDVRPEWLMGLDVPMEIVEFNKARQEARLRAYLIKLLKLSEEDQSFIFRQIDLLERDTDESRKNE